MTVTKITITTETKNYEVIYDCDIKKYFIISDNKVLNDYYETYQDAMLDIIEMTE